MVGVGQLRDQLPSQMSGGQQQRVALARAIVGGQRTILFDEPLSNVDAKVRDHLRLEILGMQRELGFTAVYVTHDQDDAMTLGTRIVVLRDGRVSQVGTPREVYEAPASRYVANFVGAADEIAGRVATRDGDRVAVDTPAGRLIGRRGADGDHDDVVAVIRPESWEVGTVEGSGPNSLAGTIETSLFLGGARTEYVVRVGDSRLRVWRYRTTADPGELAPGTRVWLGVSPDAVLVFCRGDE
jgi:iron(III) transport system ATP-binding protein